MPRNAYRIEIKKSAARALAGLPLAARRRIDAAILRLVGDPRPFGCRALQGVPNLYRLRVGDYRIVYQVKNRLLVVLVVRVGSRSDVYRGL